jgi:hypothetical protein
MLLQKQASLFWMERKEAVSSKTIQRQLSKGSNSTNLFFCWKLTRPVSVG